MVMPAEATRFFDGHKVTWLLDDTDQFTVSFWVGADDAGVGFGKSETAGAELNSTVQFGQGGGKFKRLGCWPSEDIQGQAGCSFPAYSREFAEAFDQAFEGGRDYLHGVDL